MNNKKPTDNTKKDTVKIVIEGVPEIHIQSIRMEAAVGGYRSRNALLRNIIADIHEKWVKKQGTNNSPAA